MLDVVAARVIGCLLEKEVTTPDVYPLTLAALVAAANQSTNREPVLRLEALEVESALQALKPAGLIRVVHSQSNRATKYRQILDEALGLSSIERAVVCVLLLRGAQTPGELRSRIERLHPGDEPVEPVLEALAARPEALVRRLERAPGQREARWIELLSDVPYLGVDPTAPLPPTPAQERFMAIESRLADLESRLGAAEQALGELRDSLGG